MRIGRFKAFRVNHRARTMAESMELGEITLEKFRLWTPEALKYYLSIRKRSGTGSFDDLVARAFAVSEDVPVNEEAEQAERRLLHEYKSKLTVDGETYPDPSTFEEGWESDKTGCFHWPSIYICDISDYLKKTAANNMDLINRLVNNYKEGKAYRYFTCEWVREIKYHPIRASAPCCVLQADVHASMSIRKKPYKVWVMASKKTQDCAGGEIKTAHCSCPAGLLGSCNHIAGLLFRVEAAVKSGATRPSCTEVECSWVIPQGSAARKPRKWCETSAIKDKYGQKVSKKRKEERKRAKRDFQPFSESEKERLVDKEKITEELQELFTEKTSNSVFVLTQTKRKPPQPEKPILPVPVTNATKGCLTAADILRQTEISEDDVRVVEEATRGQSASSDWQTQRQGRVTSSLFYAVNTKVETLFRVGNGAVTSSGSSWLEDQILGQKKTVQTLAMKHGLALEPAAKLCYAEIVHAQHKKWSSSNSGLVLSQEHPYLATSPDMLTECECHGKGLCEVKCPESLKDQVPYLEEVNGEVCLKRAHRYYGQIQGQLAITGRSFCDLFVYTHHGNLIVPVVFDTVFWEKMVTNLKWYWCNKIAPKLISQTSADEDLAAASPASTSSRKRPDPVAVPQKVVPVKQMRLGPLFSALDTCVSLSLSGPATRDCHAPPSKRAKGKGKKPFIQKVYQCGVCLANICEDATSFRDFSIRCDKCPQWYHQICVNIVEGCAPGADDEWVCVRCQP